MTVVQAQSPSRLSRRQFLRLVGTSFLGILSLGIPSMARAEESPFTFRTPNIALPDFPIRPFTDSVVIHHIGANDADVAAEEINQWHINKGWLGIGYHFVIRKDGTIEYGRPIDSMGAHVYHDNHHTVGVLVDGSFLSAYPTAEQYASLMYLTAGILHHYGLPARQGETILGHCDFLSTECPGACLYATLPSIADAASEYLSVWNTSKEGEGSCAVG